MYTLFEVAPIFKQLNDQSKRLGEQLIETLPCIEKMRVIPAGTDLGKICSSKGECYLLVDGTLSYTIDERLLIYFEQGDLVGIEDSLISRDDSIGGVISSDFGVRVDVYDVNSLILNNNLDSRIKFALQFLAYRNQIFTYLLRSLVKDDVMLSPVIRNFEAGQTILSQGGIDDDVYTLVEGTAEAFVNGEKVGDILRGEIFGMLAAITNSPRTATVVACERCMVAVVPKDKFISLIRSRPESVLKVVQDMGRMIVDLNNRYFELLA